MISLLKQLTKKQVAVLACSCLVITCFFKGTSLDVAQTRSLPYSYFFTIKGITPQRGDLAAIYGHTTLYHPQPLPYVKRVIGLAGDTIEQHGGYMYVAGHPVGKVRDKTKDGRPLTPLAFSTIPQGYVFVAASAWDSFDSRYQEFGLVKVQHLTGKSWGFGRQE